MRWLNVEKILQFTGPIVALMINFAVLTCFWDNFPVSIAAEVLLDSGTDLAEIDSILGIDAGLSDDQILFEEDILTSLGKVK